MTAKGRTIFLYGYYGCANLGDDLLLQALIDGITNRCPGSRFVVRNLGPIPWTVRYGDRVRLTGIDQITADQGRPRIARFLDYIRAAAQAMSGCHVFVFGGGTLWHVKESLLPMILNLALVLVARLKGLSIIALGLGTNNLAAGAQHYLARVLCNMLEFVGARDDASFQSLAPASNVHLTADLVYGWWPRDLTALSTSSRPVIAVTLTAPWFPESSAEGRVVDAALIAALTIMAGKGWLIRFLVFQDGKADTGDLSDRIAISRIANELRLYGIASEVIQPEPDPRSLAVAFSDVRVHVGARFHGHVVASLLGVAFVGLATDPKVAQLSHAFAMPVLQLKTITAEAVTRAIESAAVRSIDPRIIEELRNRAETNFVWFDRTWTAHV